MSETNKVFNSVLIANRGEIACRVIRTAKSLGYRTIAVYSDADAGAPHTQLADEAVHIGASPVNASYLVVDNILAAAKATGAQAVHPGYGFLSENADFANVCKQEGLVFIGPSANAIEVMGNKAESKRRMIASGVPCVPGYEGEQQDDDVLISEAHKIGMPVMVKAAAGGGGRGMRLVSDQDQLASAIKLARSEAENAFGSGELILEKAIIEPRHVEVQVFADQQGTTVYLGERDCSVQRRHQKVVEEAPCPIMTETLRKRMGEAAVAAAKSINYEGAGTVEFLLDSKGEFYFLEMNTRLQVEHPVTEMITGLDLVTLQLQVAQGEALGLTQDDVQLNGHAIEVRLYTEDPANNFLPTAGFVSYWDPATGDGIRIDSGIESSQAISPFYDPMVAKVIAHGPNREAARRRLISALEQTALFGVKNNKTFLIECLEKPTFIDGQATTAFIAQEFNEGDLTLKPPSFEQAAIAAVVQLEQRHKACYSRTLNVSHQLRNWSSAGDLESFVTYQFDDIEFSLSVTTNTNSGYVISNVKNPDIETVCIELESINEHRAQLMLNGQRRQIQFEYLNDYAVTISDGRQSHEFSDTISLAGESVEAEGGGHITAPMHGAILEVMVEEGQMVNKGDVLLILEAMKMQHPIMATKEGTVSQLLASVGSQVGADELLLEITVEEE
jgi:geranyl-CoA carboxylase alpha subunit